MTPTGGDHSLPDRADIAIIGGGIAGVSLAWALTRRPGRRSVVLLERETLPATHATGRNAALVLQNVGDSINCELGRTSVGFFTRPPADLPAPPVFRQVGSLLVASGPDGPARLEAQAGVVRGRGVPVELLSPAQAAARVPILDPGRISGGAFCPTDGVMDIHALFQAFLKGAEARGARLVTGCRATAIDLKDGRACGVVTSNGRLRADVVVNAAGGWAGALGAAAGAPLPLRPTRRHILVTEPAPRIDPEWPFVWYADDPFYFRPESGGLLMSACDQEDAPDCDETARPETLGLIAAKAERMIPAMSHLGVAHFWAGVRTLTPDDRFIIGFDPRVAGLFWVAGLGGHGITASPAVGEVAADLLVDGRTDRIEAAALSPARFL